MSYQVIIPKTVQTQLNIFPADTRKLMAKDLFHNSVKTALQKDGWNITHDPYQSTALWCG